MATRPREIEQAPVEALDVIASVAHEMRTPLTALLQALRVLENGRAGELGPEQLRFLRVGLRNAEALLSLTVRMQESARLEAGCTPLHFDRFDLVEPGRFTLEALSTQAEELGLALELEAEDDLPAAWGDEELVREILFNLVGNALKFTPEGGRVSVAVRAPDGALQLRVADTGPGVPLGEEDRIFDDFYQVSRSRHGRSRGAGLGLAITRRIVEAHGGAISVRNNETRGCTFTVELPAFGTGGSAVAQVRAALERHRGEKVLLVAHRAEGMPSDLLLARLRRCLERPEVVDLGQGRLGTLHRGEAANLPDDVVELVGRGCPEMRAAWSRGEDGAAEALISSALTSLEQHCEREALAPA